MRKILLFIPLLPVLLNSEITFFRDSLIPYQKFKEDNLFQYWEAVKTEGSKIFIDNNIKLTKDGSICILIEKNNSYANLYSPLVSVDENKKYFFSIFYKQIWESKGHDKFVGISSGVVIEWCDRNKKLISTDHISRFTYSQIDWDIRDAILTSPVNSAFARVKISISNNSEKQVGKFLTSRLWIDNIQFREYTPPPSPEFAKDEFLTDIDRFPTSFRLTLFFPALDPGFRGKGSKWCKIIDDTDAIKGKAVHIPQTGERGLVFHSPYFPSLPAGLYRFKIRAKVNIKQQNLNIGILDITSQFSGTRLLINFNTSNFDKEKKYTTFTEDFIIRETGWWCIRVYTEGNIEWYIDNIIIIPISNFTDEDLVEIFPGIDGFIDEDLSPRREKPLKILVFSGLFYEDYDDVLKDLGEVERIYLHVTMNTPVFDNLPEDVRAFFDNNLIFLSNINIKAIPLRYKNYIRAFVKRGGNLIIALGHLSYENTGWKSSLLEEVLPFEIEDGKFDFSKEGLFLKKDIEASFLKDVNFNESTSVYYLYKVGKLKPNCNVYVSAGGFPFLTIAVYFKGKVACFLGANTGEKTREQIPFWQADEWKVLLRNLILFLTGG
ncbi:MAG: hypothetical protein NC911_00630 [Candidatus Omnitrophica bacterium]|nr:hypothetical protein [Candidatus Omnitrophota bacterium]